MSAAATAGLILDVFGAAVLVFGTALRKSWESADMATSRYDFNPDVHVGLAKQTADSRVGAALLLIGFGGQLAGAVGVDCSAPVVVATAASGAVLVGAAAVALWLPAERRVWIRRALVNDLWRTRREAKTVWQPMIDAYGRRMGQHRRRADESPAAFAERLIGGRWREIVANDDLPEQLTAPWHPDHHNVDS